MFLSLWIIEALTIQTYVKFPGVMSITIPLAQVVMWPSPRQMQNYPVPAVRSWWAYGYVIQLQGREKLGPVIQSTTFCTSL